MVDDIGKIAVNFMEEMDDEQVSWHDRGNTIEIEIGFENGTYSFTFDRTDPDLEDHKVIAKAHSALVEAIEGENR